MYTGTEIAAAFMQQSDKKTWKATSISRPTGDTVHFSSTNGMVSLVYTVSDGRFAVKFHKFTGSWGDYIKAIARSLFTVLNTLKSAGLQFDAPANLAGMVIECTTTETTEVYVRWPGTPQPLVGMPFGVDEETELTEHLQGAGFERIHLEGLPEGVEAFGGTLPPVL